MQPNQIVTPKSFYVSERDRFYSDWSISFWRELFQNSVDAGAKTIRITLSEEKGKGSFGRDPSVSDVVRVVFDDDGCGMTGEVLDKVYFAPGETTKKDSNSTGGYGRARLMTCFSQDRYAIRTLDRVVEGDGPEYTNLTVDESREALRQHLALARRELADATGADEEETKRIKVDGIEADLALLDATSQTYKGCRVEIDVNPREHAEASWRNVGLSELSAKLDEYLSQSQIPCKVIVNGVERREHARRGPARRKLVAELESHKVPEEWRDAASGIAVEGNENGTASVEFATVHLSQSDKAQHKGSVIVRVNGAAMFVKSTSAGQQVIVEIAPRISRDVMTSNRDGLREPYDSILQDYMEFLATDSSKALEDAREREFVMVRGGKGRKTARPIVEEINFGEPDEVAAFAGAEAPKPKARARAGVEYVDWERYVEAGFGGIPHDVMESFLRVVRNQGTAGTFLQKFHDQDEVIRLGVQLERGSETALRSMSRDLASFVTSELALRIADVERKRREDLEGLNDLHDVPIQKDGLEPQNPNLSEKERKRLRRNLTNSIWRNDPRNFKPDEGKGLRPRRLLAGWTTAVDCVLRAYMELNPSAEPFEWAAGWYFGQPKWEWMRTKGGYGLVRTHAQHQVRNDVHLFLLNPLNDEGNKLAFNPARTDDKDVLISDAIHEVAHVASSRHDSDFAMVQSQLVRAFGVERRRQTHREIDTAVAAASRAFGRGRTRVQAMDNEEGPRPAERLLGAPLSDDDRYDGCISHDADGTAVVDCDGVNGMDEAVSSGYDGGIKP